MVCVTGHKSFGPPTMVHQKKNISELYPQFCRSQNLIQHPSKASWVCSITTPKMMINPGVLGGTKFSDIPMWVICIWSARNNKNQDERSGGMHSFTHNLFTAGRHQSCSLKNACNMERSVLWLMATTPPTLVEISTTTLPRTAIDVDIIVIKLHKMIPRVVFNNGVRVLNPHPSYSGMLQCARQVR